MSKGNCKTCGQARSTRPIVKKGQTTRAAALANPVVYSQFNHSAYSQDLSK